MVVFYSSMTAEHHNALVKAFNKKNPQIKLEGFRSNSISVLNRVLNEGRAGNHLVDVINVNELNAWVLKDRGLLQAHKSRETEAFPKEFRDPEEPLALLRRCLDQRHGVQHQTGEERRSAEILSRSAPADVEGKNRHGVRYGRIVRGLDSNLG